mmetsp:Transcript_2439/g.6294  ORF Transcript_2439/g.6294 Transcript_2439/m.6294 type:complete len:213 (-) Transcript_2439:640-1278(-)
MQKPQNGRGTEHSAVQLNMLLSFLLRVPLLLLVLLRLLPPPPPGLGLPRVLLVVVMRGLLPTREAKKAPGEVGLRPSLFCWALDACRLLEALSLLGGPLPSACSISNPSGISTAMVDESLPGFVPSSGPLSDAPLHCCCCCVREGSWGADWGWGGTTFASLLCRSLLCRSLLSHSLPPMPSSSLLLRPTMLRHCCRREKPESLPDLLLYCPS